MKHLIMLNYTKDETYINPANINWIVITIDEKADQCAEIHFVDGSTMTVSPQCFVDLQKQIGNTTLNNMPNGAEE